jgi:hypothetical protein
MRVRVPQHRLLRCNDVRRSEAAADVQHAHLLCAVQRPAAFKHATAGLAVGSEAAD